jgi:hypothetical protein|tara:strand:+ start:258 stop:542 length:285 start_codon:yes stop_codon:yes gene_type:complete
MLSKQSIRGNVKILLDDEVLTKDQILEFNKEWSEKEELLFRKMLKQGGVIRIQGKKFKIENEENINLNSRGNTDAPITPMDYTEDDVDPNYIRR